jgi:hypothetical protein
MTEQYFNLYKEARLSVQEFFFFVLIYEENHDFLEYLYNQNFLLFARTINRLEEQGLVKHYGDKPTDILFRTKGETLFKKYVKIKKKKVDVTSWIDAWREIFPAGANPSGYRYRGSRLEVIRKMTKFVASNNYTEEEIFQATRNYVERFALKGYMYMQQAHYFIEKQGAGSSLASECEALKENSNSSKSNKNYGGTVV